MCLVCDAIRLKKIFHETDFFSSFCSSKVSKRKRRLISLGITRKSRACETEKRKKTSRMCTYSYSLFNALQSIINSPFMNFVSNLSPIRFGASSLGGNNTVVPICFSSPSAFKRYVQKRALCFRFLGVHSLRFDHPMFSFCL